MFCALCIGMIVASVAGIAYGYNYCMAEFLTLTSRSEVTVFMRRGKFYDPPDIKSPLVFPSGRRSGGRFEDDLNANMTSDYDENMRRARAAAAKSLGDAWVKSDDTRRYAERLTKFSDHVDSNERVDSNDVIIHVTPSTTMAAVRRVNVDDSGKYSDSEEAIRYNDKINDNDAELSKTTLPTTTLDARKYGDDNNIDKTWKFAEEFPKYAGGGEKSVKENTPLPSTTLDSGYDRAESTWKFSDILSKVDTDDRAAMLANAPMYTTTVDTQYRANADNSWQFAEPLSKFDGEKMNNVNVVKVETIAPIDKPTRTPVLSKLGKHKAAAARTHGPGHLNFLKPLRTTDSRTTPEELINYAKGRMGPRRTTLKRSDSKIKFVERKHQDNKATTRNEHMWVTRTIPTAPSPEEYSSSEEDDEDIVYKSV